MNFLKKLAVVISALLVFSIILVIVIYVKNRSCFDELPDAPNDKTTIHGVTTIDDAVKYVDGKNLSGWKLVEFSQHLVAEKMAFSLCNNFDMPDRAFERGMGYSWQQASALKEILDHFDVESRMVHSSEVNMPADTLYGVKVSPRKTGHIWLKVKIDGEEKDVCPGNIENVPGVVHFTNVEEVKDFGEITEVFSYIGSAWANAEKYLKIKRKE